MIGCDRLASERCPFAERIFTVSPDLGFPFALSHITVLLAPVSTRNQSVCPRIVNWISGLLMLWWKISSKFISSSFLLLSYASHVLGLLLGVACCCCLLSSSAFFFLQSFAQCPIMAQIVLSVPPTLNSDSASSSFCIINFLFCAIFMVEGINFLFQHFLLFVMFFCMRGVIFLLSYWSYSKANHLFLNKPLISGHKWLWRAIFNCCW